MKERGKKPEGPTLPKPEPEETPYIISNKLAANSKTKPTKGKLKPQAKSPKYTTNYNQQPKT